MTEGGDPTLRWRALLTETLPYELPLIFSNDLLYASLVRPSEKDAIKDIVKKMRTKAKRATIPYNYQIAKDSARSTNLSVIHPNQQLQINDFYELYRQTLIDYCSNSECTLRRPVAEMAIYSANPLDEETTHRSGIPHIIPEDRDIDVSRMTSYFSYGRYNLLRNFIDSAEYRSFETKFKYLRTVDISKCFFNIYTHSIAWAVKGKTFAKDQIDVYSFEHSFDHLMQRSNYGETNGIVVGPEISRIFAEIIMQDVDRRVIKRMLPQTSGVEYAIRRYVDDFFLFAQDVVVLDKLELVLSAELENYKLFLNSAKTNTETRPFVSPITLARSELAGLTAEMHECIDVLFMDADVITIRKSARKLNRIALNVRLIAKRHDVEFSSISGSLLSTLLTLLKRCASAIQASADHDELSSLTDMAVTILEIAFYITSLDLRVRSTYSLCQITSFLKPIIDKNDDVSDRLAHCLSEGIGNMIGSLVSSKSTADPLQLQFIIERRGPVVDCVELYNLMISGAYFLDRDFLTMPVMTDAIATLASRPLTYFAYITLKFCFLKDRSRFKVLLQRLNVAVCDILQTAANKLSYDTETYLLACDYLSAPDVSPSDKRRLVTHIFGGQPAARDCVTAGKYLGFVDWRGVRITHLLARKRLRPVYSWS